MVEPTPRANRWLRLPTPTLARGFAIALTYLVAIPFTLWGIDRLTSDPQDVVYSPIKMFGALVYLPVYVFLWKEGVPEALRVPLSVLQIIACSAAFAWFARRQTWSEQLSTGLYTFLAFALLCGAYYVYVGP